jgi:hypothetical protein
MPNKPRPRCPSCNVAMAPLFRKRPRGSGYARAGTAFQCLSCERLAHGRGGKAKFLPPA